MSRSFQGNFFEDFTLGQELTCATPRTIDAAMAQLYIALTGERTPAYCDGSGLVNPWVVFHVAFGQTVRAISLNAVANLGYAGLQWHGPVHVGETIRTRLEIVGLKENSSKTAGIVWVRNEATATNAAGASRTVLTWWRWVMVRKRGSEPTAWLEAPAVPEGIPEHVAADALVATGDALRDAVATGGCWFFEDYAVGERIHAWDAMQVNPSDHMAFTRLFQNSAKVHFDAHGQDGRPLVYGGVVIAQAYALAHNGLENRLGPAAINAGAHANPTYAGDTLYAYTEVLEKADIPQHPKLGALRLRLVAVKNRNPAAEERFEAQTDHPTRAGVRVYDPAVVLDLDYWEVVARRT